MNISETIKHYQNKKIEYYYAGCLILIYAIWKVVKLVSSTIPSLEQFGNNTNEFLVNMYVACAEGILNIFAFDFHTFITKTSYGNFSTIALDGASGIYIAYHCLGVTASLLYAITLYLLPGTLKRKIFFTIVGLATMFIANLVRIIGLILLDKYASKFWVELNHSVIFVILFYSLLLVFHYHFLKPYLNRKK